MFTLHIANSLFFISKLKALQPSLFPIKLLEYTSLQNQTALWFAKVYLSPDCPAVLL